MRYTAMINGFDSLIVTKLDVLDGFDEIKVCTAYKAHGVVIETMPAENLLLEQIEPVYETLPGWPEPTSGITTFNELPKNAKDYIEFLEQRTGVEVGCVSTGPERMETIIRPGSKLERLLA